MYFPVLEALEKLPTFQNAVWAFLTTVVLALLALALKRPFMRKAVENEVFKATIAEQREGFLGQIAGWKLTCERHEAWIKALEAEAIVKQNYVTQLEQQIRDRNERDRPLPQEPDDDTVILAAEDNNIFAIAFRKMMERINRKVFVVTTGYDALRALRTYPQFRLLVLDLGLPDINGVQVAVQARREGFEIPILGISGLAGHMDENDPEVLKANFIQVLPKTTRVSEVCRTVGRILDEAKG